MGETSGGQLRFVRQETPITPKHLSRFGIEVDDALRVGVPDFWESPIPEKPGCRQNQKASNKNFSSSQRG